MNEARLAKEREELLAEVYAAFGGVTREGGVSWSEADIIDDYGTAEERELARQRDTETAWEELVDAPDWDPRWGPQFSFLDGIGFRYYLAPAMVRCLRSSEPGDLDFFLTLHKPRPPEHVHVTGPGVQQHAEVSTDDDLRPYKLAQWAMLDARQRTVVARFVRFMIEAVQSEDERVGWERAYRSYWAGQQE